MERESCDKGTKRESFIIALKKDASLSKDDKKVISKSIVFCGLIRRFFSASSRRETWKVSNIRLSFSSSNLNISSFLAFNILYSSSFL